MSFAWPSLDQSSLTNSDDTIGKTIAEAMDQVGKDGRITVEEAKTMEPSLEVAGGSSVA